MLGLFSSILARGLTFAPPETAHRIGVLGLAWGLGPRVSADRWPRLRTRLAGLELPNPLGLAAGFDKDAEAVDGALAMGFGFVECGTVTPLPQPGSPRPRLFRLRADGALINRMGFNNRGLEAFAQRLARRAGRGGVVGANLGANKDSTDRIGDYVQGLRAVAAHAAYVTVNLSSPNTPGLRALQTGAALDELLERLAPARAEVPPRPLFLKLAPDLADAEIEAVVARALAWSVDGLILTNTTIARPAWLKSSWRGETGGLSGAPLFEASTSALRVAARAADGKLALIGAGGVRDARTALAKLRAGASAVQLYTALAYKGPGLIPKLLAELDARLAAEGFHTIADAVGADQR